MECKDDRVKRTADEENALLIARKRAEAEADLADERIKITVVGSGVVGIVSVFIMLVAAFRDNTGMLIAAGTIALVSFGVVTAAQAGLLFGRGL